MAKTSKQLRASQFNWGKYLVRGMIAQVRFFRSVKIIRLRDQQNAIAALHGLIEAIEDKAESEGFNVNREG